MQEPVLHIVDAIRDAAALDIHKSVGSDLLIVYIPKEAVRIDERDDHVKVMAALADDAIGCFYLFEDVNDPRQSAATWTLYRVDGPQVSEWGVQQGQDSVQLLE